MDANENPYGTVFVRNLFNVLKFTTISKEELVKACGITHQRLNFLERGVEDRPVGLDEAKKLFLYIGICLGWPSHLTFDDFCTKTFDERAIRAFSRAREKV